VIEGVTDGQRFQRFLRLKDAGQYRRVFQHPIRSSDRAFTVLARLNSYKHARVGFAISRKCAARATARNRIKRLVRESFRVARSQLPPADLVVMCRSVVNDMSNAEVAASLEAHWRRLEARCKDS
jgi:ribonuclease P protein component